MTTEATLQKQQERARIGIALLQAWLLGCHDWWRRIIGGAMFNELEKCGMMERREYFELYGSTTYEYRLTPKGLAALAKLHDALALGLE